MPWMSVNGAHLYHEVAGSGEAVVLLHGGFSSLESLRPQQEALASHFRVHAPERPGHGRSPDVAGPVSYESALAGTLAYMDAMGVADAHVIGFSDGAIIGLLLALQYPQRCTSLVAISGNLDPSGFVDDQDRSEWPRIDGAGETDVHRVRYDALSPDGPDHAAVMLEKLYALWTTEPNIDPASLSAVTCPVLVVAGDRDVIRPEHSRLIATSIRKGQLCIVPGTGHDLLEERPGFVTRVIEEFLEVRS